MDRTDRSSPDDTASRVLEGTGIERRLLRSGRPVLEAGEGPAVVLLHGTRDPSSMWVPLMACCRGLRLIAADRPQARPRAEAVAWVDALLDDLELESAILVGHSAGGLWALWEALERPERVDHLVMIGTPALPGTVVPLPFRLVATPGLGRLVVRQRATPAGVRRFAEMMGEGATIGSHPALIDLLVAVGNDRPSVDAGRAEVRQLISPWALLRRRAFRPLVGEADLRAVRVPTTLFWGTRDPVGSVPTARAITALIPDADLRVFEAGHVPWFGDAEAVADALLEIAR